MKTQGAAEMQRNEIGTTQQRGKEAELQRDFASCYAQQGQISPKHKVTQMWQSQEHIRWAQGL